MKQRPTESSHLKLTYADKLEMHFAVGLETLVAFASVVEGNIAVLSPAKGILLLHQICKEMRRKKE